MEEQYYAFDESGNTGGDLLNREQPVFILSSVRLTENQSQELRSLLTAKADELKFARLKKSKKYQKEIISLLNHSIISDETVQIALFHKQYCLWLHTVDRLIEPVLKEDIDCDVYEDGQNIAITNMFFFCVPAFCDVDAVEEYKHAFINLFQFRDEVHIDRFYTAVENLIASSKDEKFVDALLPILGSYRYIDDILDRWDKYNFDSTLAGFINLIDYWGRKTDKGFYAFVDNSKPLVHHKELIDLVRDINKEGEIGTERRKLKFPLKLIDIKFADSKDVHAVQIADVIAGAANHYYKAIADPQYADEFSEMLGQTKLVELIYSPVWPHMAFTPEELGTKYDGGENILDSLASLSIKKDIDD
ncbi:DUF3800 domain-containing protein [Flavobacterium sp. F52]|uniref:DUF3800 domain-containing protein n=1 Tax=Flavobacterium sp. F52 TaxID=1202532 RepID=UPI0002730903|nr:DUF3800 domain-containing protein [Flavobacterium sp. F52]EJG02015.1 hypothetical protein FF52_08404 [Flavobacterium sp. F52]